MNVCCVRLANTLKWRMAEKVVTKRKSAQNSVNWLSPSLQAFFEVENYFFLITGESASKNVYKW